ncbi:MAG: hypothetical protein R6U27_07235 [Desulfobacterales bacterium]
MTIRTCVLPSGRFIYGVHKPCFKVDNFRENDFLEPLGCFIEGALVQNNANFPVGNVQEPEADTIFEIPNPLAFRGTTFISKSWADKKAQNPGSICLSEPDKVSCAHLLEKYFIQEPNLEKRRKMLFESFPEPLLLALAKTGTDPQDLVSLAKISCEFMFEPGKTIPSGLMYQKNKNGYITPVIKNEDLFETLANNHYLPNDYKKVMVLRPGVQGNSEIVGEARDDHSHVFEYLRRNSYIPWGHYAANMAHDSIRYNIDELTAGDMKAMRHLYYQRTYARLARELDIPVPDKRKRLTAAQLENIRKKILSKLSSKQKANPSFFNCTLWGWNYGFDFSPTKYRLHASHQQIHQQFALIPSRVESQTGEGWITPFACGDMICEFIREFLEQTGKHFFKCYIQAIRSNLRMDNTQGESSLIIFEDNHVMVFVPKAQTSQWEIQIMCTEPIGNILEADNSVRDSLDRAILITMRILSQLGAKMVTAIEYAKRIDSPDTDQRLIYSFLPKIPHSPGAFSESQLRWINGHYPEDFAFACRAHMKNPE